MSGRIPFGNIDVHLVASMTEGRGIPDEEIPFRILVMGDFSGRANRRVSDSRIALRRPISVDRDNIDEVLAKLRVELVLSVLGEEREPFSVSFAAMDDFHPDRLFERLACFDAVKHLKNRLKSQDIAKVLKEGGKKPSSGESREMPLKASPSSTGLLDRIIDEAGRGQAVTRSLHGEPQIQKFLEDITEPHLVASPDPDQIELMASVDEITGEMMRRLLHHPDFQALESLWRGLLFLVKRLETDENLKIYLLDVSKEELAADLMSSDDLTKTGAYRILAGEAVKTMGGQPWAVVVGHYQFGAEAGEIELLGRMAKIARVAGAPFLSAADRTVLGCPSWLGLSDPDQWDAAGVKDTWSFLRGMPEAAWLGLALPRFLLRLPYGEKTEPLESFPFEEMQDPSVHEHYLWGNPAWICVYLLGRSFLEEGWHLQPGRIVDVTDLPLYVYKAQGESVAKPCAEVLLTEKAAQKILDKGLLLLLSYPNRDTIRLACFQSLADPPASLQGKWEE